MSRHVRTGFSWVILTALGRILGVGRYRSIFLFDINFDFKHLAVSTVYRLASVDAPLVDLKQAQLPARRGSRHIELGHLRVS